MVRDLCADASESEYAQSLPGKILAYGVLPLALTQRGRLRDQMPGACEDERPGQLDRGAGKVTGMGHLDAAGSRGGHIDRGVARRR